MPAFRSAELCGTYVDMENKFNPKTFLNDPSVKTYADGYSTGHSDALEWAANWIENSAKANGHPAAVEFAKNMAMTFRAAKMKKPA